MKIAIIGSGFFGTTLGLILSKKHFVDIYEKEEEILQGASRANQFRFHHGYHYPRSQKTIKEINKYKSNFVRFFGKKIFDKTLNYYSISNVNSKTSLKKYIIFLKKNNLYFKRYYSKKYFSKLIKGSFLVNEKILNYFKIKKSISRMIKKSNVNLILKKKFSKKNLNKYDKVIIATYDNNNLILKNLGIKPFKKYKYELVEKILVLLPKAFKNKSFVVLDGNFVCLDPYLGTKYHLLSDVKNSKLEVNNSIFPNFKHKNKRYLNKGVIKNIKLSNFEKFKKNSSKFLPFINKSKYIGSYYVVRAINVNVENTDERLNSIDIINNKIINIFSGKWNTCVGVAKTVNKILN